VIERLNDMASSDDTIGDTEQTAGGDTTTACMPRLVKTATLLAGIAVIAGSLFGYMQYRGAADELDQIRHDEANRNTAAQLAKDYALRSLTYSFEDPDAFFRSVQEGASSALKDKFANAAGFLKSLMLQAQVSSTGEVVAADPLSEPGDIYEVVVSAYQTTRNLQHAEPRVSAILLRVTVSEVGDTWQVSDIGPKPGNHTPVNGEGSLPGLGGGTPQRAPKG